MEEKGFENADIVFITDGECVLPPEFISRLQEEQVRRRFTITGILLDPLSKYFETYSYIRVIHYRPAFFAN